MSEDDRARDDRAVMFDLPFPLELPSTTNTETPELVVEGEVPAMVQFILRANERPPVRAAGVAAGGDPYGRLAYTTVFVRFHASTSPVVDEWTDEERVEAAVAALNRLLEHYRDVANQALVRPIAVKHIVHFKLLDARPGEDQEVRHYGRGSGPIYINVAERQQRNAQEIQARLTTGERPPFLRLLFLDVQARMETGEYRQAVVECAIVFESWIRRRLVEAYSAAGVDESGLRERFSTARGTPRSVTELVKANLPEALGFDFENSPQFAPWDEARQLRNQIVHGEREDVGLDEARKALDSFLAAMTAIQAALVPPGSTVP